MQKNMKVCELFQSECWLHLAYLQHEVSKLNLPLTVPLCSTESQTPLGVIDPAPPRCQFWNVKNCSLEVIYLLGLEGVQKSNLNELPDFQVVEIK